MVGARPLGEARPAAFPALRVLGRNLVVYRRIWRGSLFLTFLQPVLFLAAMGIGLGGFVDRAGPGMLAGVPYAAFLAPGLLAAQAMQTAAFEASWPLMARITWRRNYEAMLATPLRVRDLLAGELLWFSFRLALVGASFLAVMVAFGTVRSALAVVALPAAILTGLAFAAPITAFTAMQRTGEGFNALFRFGITPLFLFSGTFFPIDRLPELIRPVAYVTPLYHGVALTRDLTLGTLDPAADALHAVVLLAFAAGGAAIAWFALRRRLVK